MSDFSGYGYRAMAVIGLMLPYTMNATETAPWYPRAFEIRPCAEYQYQYFRKVNSGHHDFSYLSHDSFLNLNIGVPYYNWYGECELLFAGTRHRSFGYDSFRLTARYQILDDVSGDDNFSVIPGLTLITAPKIAVHDIGSFHHGKLEGEAFISAGKEFSCKEYWTSRFWGILGVGTADVGSPWIRFNINWERNYWDVYSWGVFVNTLWGLGGDRLSSPHHFRGYGPIQHQTIDLGAIFHYAFEFGGEATIKYAYRVYAKNFPENANLITIRFCYPFGL